jgi:hypothetical protein
LRISPGRFEPPRFYSYLGLDALGGLDIAANNAGIWVEHLIEDVSLA